MKHADNKKNVSGHNTPRKLIAAMVAVACFAPAVIVSGTAFAEQGAPADSTQSQSATDQQSAAGQSSSTPAQQDGDSTATTPSNKSATASNGSTTPRSAAPGSATPSNKSATPESATESNGSTTSESPSTDSPTASAPVDWTTNLDDLVLSSDEGLVFSSGESEASNKSADKKTKAKADASDAEAKLPATLAATLQLGFRLDSADSLKTGDYFAVDLPKELKATNTNADQPIDVYQYESDTQSGAQANANAGAAGTAGATGTTGTETAGTASAGAGSAAADITAADDPADADADVASHPTDLKIAEATIADGKLTVTFIDPVTGENPAISQQERDESLLQSQSAQQSMRSMQPSQAFSQSADGIEAFAGAKMPSIAQSSLTIDVDMSSDLVKDEATQISWLLQQAAESAESAEGVQAADRTAALTVPSRADMLKKLGLAEQSETDQSDRATNGSNALTPATKDAKPSITDLAGSVSFTNQWFDNNDTTNRPAVADVLSQYQLWFQIDGKDGACGTDGPCLFSNFDADGNRKDVTAEAKDVLNYDAWTAGKTARLTYEEPSVGTTVVSLDQLPKKYAIGGSGAAKQDIIWALKDLNQVAAGINDRPYPAYPSKVDSEKNDPLKDLYRVVPKSDTDDVNDAMTSDKTQNLLLLQDVNYTVIGKTGDTSLQSAALTEKAKLTVYSGNNTATCYNLDGTVRSGGCSMKIGDLLGKDLFLTLDTSTNIGTTASRWPVYAPTADGTSSDPLTYKVTFDGVTDPNDETQVEKNDLDTSSDDYADYFQVEYNNQNSPNFGTKRDGMYPGGEIKVIHAGTTAFDATKQWFDEDATKRPALEFTLWRYANRDGSTAATAAQVYDNNAFVKVTVPAKSADEVDLGELLREQYDQLQLPKYDPDGFPYVYEMREEYNAELNKAGYAQEYGEVETTQGDKQGTIIAGSDKAPNHYKISTVCAAGATQDCGTESIGGAPDRRSDTYIYNNGTIVNRLKGTVTPSQEKTWKAAAFQDQLGKVEVEFTLQQRRKNPDPGQSNSWKTVTTKNLGGWDAEFLTQTVSEAQPKYNALGKELEYRWIESGVCQNDIQEVGVCTPVTFTVDTADPESNSGRVAHFSVTIANLNGTTQTLSFTSTQKATKDASGNLKYEPIVNSIDDKVEEHVLKLWDGKTYEELGSRLPDWVEEGKGKVTVRLIQDNTTDLGKKAGDVTFALDGVADDAAKEYSYKDNAGNTITFHVQETSPYYLKFTDLPKYSVDGHQYSYVIVEGSGPGWAENSGITDLAAPAVGHLTKLNNVQPPVGKFSRIRISKTWLDGSDVGYRLALKVDLKAKQPLTIDGTEYETGAIVRQDITLNQANAWYQEVTFGTGGLTNDMFTVEETAMCAEGAAGTCYPVQTSTEVTGNGDFDDWTVDWNDGKPRVATGDHVYEVTYQKNTVLDSLEINNRRLGLTHLAATKTWVDQGANADDRPDADLVLKTSDYAKGDVFLADSAGNVSIQLKNNTGSGRVGNVVPLYYMYNQAASQTGEALTAADRRNAIRVNLNTALDAAGNPIFGTGAASGTTTQGTITYTTYDEIYLHLDKTSASGEARRYAFIGMPKYDGDGVFVKWSLSEQWTKQDHGDYQTSSSRGEYKVYSRHFNDVQSTNFTNRRSNTRDVVFHKIWRDHYVYTELNKRPDLHLNLFQSTDGETMTAVTVATQQVWAEEKESDQVTSAEKGNGYQQQVTYPGMPKYDAAGAEITYYAQEVLSADSGAYYYKPVELTTEKGVDAAKPQKIVATTTSPVDDRDYAVIENGTFNNGITRDLTVDGRKLWVNLSLDFNKGVDLPDLAVYLQQQKPYDDNGNPIADANAPWETLQADPQTGTVTGADLFACTATLAQIDPNQYSFEMKTKGANGTEACGINGSTTQGTEAIPGFDDLGYRYTYRTQEFIWGLQNTPGGFDSNMPVTEGALDNVFTVSHGISGNYRVTNTYKSDGGKLTVKKNLLNRKAGDAFPDVTFQLYRYYESGTGPTFAQYPAEGDRTPVAQQTITAEQFKANDADGDGNSDATTTFDGLDIYAPNGEYWQYYAVEVGIHGYDESSVILGNAELADVIASGTLPGRLCDTSAVDATCTSDPAMENNKTMVADNDTVDITFSNKYTEPEKKPLSLTGVKTWYDTSDTWGLRPDTYDLKLTLSRKSAAAGAISENLTCIAPPTTGETDECTFEWTGDQGNQGKDWSYEYANLERYAPDGTAYTYTVTEELTKDQKEDYSPNGGASKDVTPGDATEAKVPALINDRKHTTITGTKQWFCKTTGKACDDTYGLRPDVTLQLQAKDANGNWTDALTALTSIAMKADSSLTEAEAKETLTGVNYGLTEAEVTKVLKHDANSTKLTWNANGRLPAAYRDDDADNARHTISYRVIETKIGDQAISGTTLPEPDGTYQYEDVYKTYQIKQVTNSDGTTTTITNTLDDTSFYGQKSWKDEDNAWDTRDPGKNPWTVTYKMQRKLTTDTAWGWLTKYGQSIASTVPEAERGFDPAVVESTITGNKNDADANKKLKEFANLPRVDGVGNTYDYRLVEVVPGSYDATLDQTSTIVGQKTNAAGGIDYLVTYDDTKVTTTTPGTKDDPQTFTNTLQTTDLKGNKLWDDDGTGLTPAFDPENAPKMDLYRSVVGGNAEQVKKTGVADLQPVWTDAGSGTWTFTYKGLPRANKSNLPYTYWAVEREATVSGFHPVYGTAGAEGTTGAGSQSSSQTGTTITNVINRFKLDKAVASAAGGSSSATKVNNVKLVVTTADYELGDSRTKTYAVWERDGNGKVTSTVWPEGKDYDWTVEANQHSQPEGGTAMPDDSGYIAGLKGRKTGTSSTDKTGYYWVHEVYGPTDYAIANPIRLTLWHNGTLAINPGSSGSCPRDQYNEQFCTITVPDPILKGQVSLVKTLEGITPATGVEKAKFELYIDPKQDTTSASAGTADDIKVTGNNIVTDAEGKWNSTDHLNWPFTQEFINALATNPVQRATFGDGLPVGSYYFKEIGVDNDAVHGNGGNVIFRFTLERNTEQVPYPGNPPSGTTWPMAVVVTAQADATNPPFKASFTATKYDDSSLLHPGIKGVEFTLEKVCPTTPTTASVLCKKAPAGTETKVQVGSDGNAFVSAKKIVSGVGGKVSFAITEKGTYVFTEKSNTGYDPSRFITLEFTIEEGDYNAGSAVDLSAIASRSSSVVSQGSITSEGIPNVRITPGSLPLTGEHSGLIWLSAIGGAGLLALLAWAGTSLSRRRRDS